MSENIELVERLRCSPKLMIFVTDNFLLSLWDLSGRAFVLFPEGLLLTMGRILGVRGVVGDCSKGNDNDDLFSIMPSSCS